MCAWCVVCVLCVLCGGAGRLAAGAHGWHATCNGRSDSDGVAPPAQEAAPSRGGLQGLWCVWLFHVRVCAPCVCVCLRAAYAARALTKAAEPLCRLAPRKAAEPLNP